MRVLRALMVALPVGLDFFIGIAVKVEALDHDNWEVRP